MSDPIKTSKVIVDGKEYQLPTGANLLGELLKLGRDEYPGYGMAPPSEAGANGSAFGEGFTRLGDWVKYPDQTDHGEHYTPHYCWHPGLSVSGNCRMCFVNITSQMKQGDKVVDVTTPGTACTNTVRDGIRVDTKSELVRKIQNGVQEFLLINHPLDCPECDKSGECRLQDYAFDFSRGFSRFEEKKVAAHIKQLGPTIDFFGTRCIQCSRCIRFCDEVSGTHELCFVNRGDRTTVDTFPGEPIDNRLDLNVVQLCPVGALKNHEFLYEARVWSMAEKASVCNLCARGCAVRYDSLKGVVRRVMAEENPGVNGFWACNEGRLNHTWINRLDRMLQPTAKGQEASWMEVYVGLCERLKSEKGRGGSLAVVVNCSQTVEELFLMRTLFRDLLGCSTFAAIARPNAKPPQTFEKFRESEDRNPNRRGVELVFGIADADASIEALAKKLKEGRVSTLVVVNNAWDGFVPGPLKESLGRAEFTVGVCLFGDEFAQRLDYALPGRSHAEKDGSFINEDWRLQAFRAAVQGVAGQDDGVIWQELIDRLDDGEVNSPVLSSAAVFSNATKAIPQLEGYTHRSLRQTGGVKLM